MFSRKVALSSSKNAQPGHGERTFMPRNNGKCGSIFPIVFSRPCQSSQYAGFLLPRRVQRLFARGHLPASMNRTMRVEAFFRLIPRPFWFKGDRMSSSDFEDLKAPFFRLFGKLPFKTSKTFLLLPLWREAVGPLASRTELRSLDEGQLNVVVDPAFLEDLNRAKDLVLRRLNARLRPWHVVERIELTAAPCAQQQPLAYVHSRRSIQRNSMNRTPR